MSWLQNLNFKLGALRHEKRRGLAFYTGTSCLSKLLCCLNIKNIPAISWDLFNENVVTKVDYT